MHCTKTTEDEQTSFDHTRAMLTAALLLCATCALAARSRLADHGPSAPPPPAFTPATDVPYEELVPQRFVLASAAPIYNWGQLPFDDVAQVASGQLDGSTGAFVLSSSSLLFIQYNANFTQTSVALDGISLEAWSPSPRRVHSTSCRAARRCAVSSMLQERTWAQ